MSPYCIVASEDAIPSDDVWNLLMERGNVALPTSAAAGDAMADVSAR